MDLLKVDNIAFSYGKREIFHDLSLSINPGEVFCVVGPNGCGKSTFLDTILGFNKPSMGSITILGKDAKKMKPRELASYIAYVPQGHKSTFSYTVLQIVMMGQEHDESLLSGENEAKKEIAMAAINKVGLSGFEERDYTTLSGGELQLVLIARALAQNAKILILDEPTAHLDFRHELNVMELLAKLVKENDLSVIMATHFLNQAYFLENAGVKTTVGLFGNHTFDKIGTPHETLVPETLEEIFSIVSELATDKEGKRKYILALHNKRS